jgi:hypothetical protein
MPSRLGVVLILGFWLAVTGYVVHRDVWPRLFGDAPPTVRIDLSDEATQTVPARWTIYRDGESIGSITTRMSYDADDNRFLFTSTYREVKLDQAVLQFRIRFELKEMQTTTSVTRDGELRGQKMTGSLSGLITSGPIPLLRADATVEAEGTVVNGELVGWCGIDSDLGSANQKFDPVPVPAGQVLNPLQPVNRLRDVRPGARWEVHQVDPLADAIAALVPELIQKHAGTKLTRDLRPGERPSLIARVSDRPVDLPPLPPPPPRAGEPGTPGRPRANEGEPCWVIEYRGDQAMAKTWVRVSDGKVLRQEAARQGEVLLLERND